MIKTIKKVLQDWLGIKPKLPSENVKTREIRGFASYTGGAEEEVVGGVVVISKDERDFLQEICDQMFNAVSGHKKGKLRLRSINISIK